MNEFTKTALLFGTPMATITVMTVALAWWIEWLRVQQKERQK